MDAVTNVFGVFTKVTEWLVSSVESVVPVFYNSDTGLTFIGTISLCSLGIGASLLVLNYIKDFIKFR